MATWRTTKLKNLSSARRYDQIRFRFTRPRPKAVQKAGWCGKITRPEIAAMPKLSISWQRLNSASELRNLTATMARMNCATIVGEIRSEEHTSELQSRPHLVCRL